MAKLYFLRPTQESNTWSTIQLILVYRVGMLLQKLSSTTWQLCSLCLVSQIFYFFHTRQEPVFCRKILKFSLKLEVLQPEEKLPITINVIPIIRNGEHLNWCSAAVVLQTKPVVQEARVQGVQVHPQKFWFVKIRTKSLKIRAKSREIWEKSVKTFVKSLKIWANSENTSKNGAQRLLIWKMAPNVFLFEKWRRTCFDLKKWRPIRSSWENIRTKSGPKFFRASVGNSGKNPSHHQKLACSYTYGRSLI